MPDITMCVNQTCPNQTRCIRHQASGTEMSEHQSMCEFKWQWTAWLSEYGYDPSDPPTEVKCEMFIEKGA